MAVVTDTGAPIAPGIKLAANQWADAFRRADGPLGNGWTDGHDWGPTIYEPLGIYQGTAVCTNPRTRGGTYEPDQSVHPPSPPGTLYQGIGCAWREFGTDEIRASYIYSGLWTPPIHVEGGPLLHVVPGTPEHGFGAWLTYAAGISILAIGCIRNPPEDWGTVPGAGTFAAVPHTEGIPRTIELVSDGTGVTTFLDGVQVSMGGGTGLDPFPLPANLLGSTLHGFCVDTHLTTEAAIPTTPVVNAVAYTT